MRLFSLFPLPPANRGAAYLHTLASCHHALSDRACCPRNPPSRTKPPLSPSEVPLCSISAEHREEVKPKGAPGNTSTGHCQGRHPPGDICPMQSQSCCDVIYYNNLSSARILPLAPGLCPFGLSLGSARLQHFLVRPQEKSNQKSMLESCNI